MVEHKVGSLLIIDAFKETYAACGLFLFILLVYKGCYTANGFIISTLQYPACTFAFSKKLILIGIKYFFYILIQWPYPIGQICIELRCHVKE